MRQFTAQIPSAPRTRWSIAFAVAVAAFALTAAGCHPTLKVDIPQMDTVDTQFAYAMQQHEQYSRAGARTSDRKTKAAIAIAAYQKLVDAFPDEHREVGRARLGIAMILNDEGQQHRALGIFEELIKSNADDDVVLVNSMFNAAGILSRMGRAEEARAFYRKIMDGYTGSLDPSFSDMANRSRYFYNLPYARYR